MIIKAPEARESYTTFVVDLDNPEHEEACHQWGGLTLARVCVIENGKKTWVWLNVRKSGDPRGGSKAGAHMTLTVGRRSTDVQRTAHARPWCPIEEDDQVNGWR